MKKIILIIFLVHYILFNFSPVKAQIDTKAQNDCNMAKVQYLSDRYICNNNNWVLVFEDNFDGNNVDITKWKFSEWDHIRYCNPEQQYYTNGENIEVSNGTMKIIAKNEYIRAKIINYYPDDHILGCENGDQFNNLRDFNYTSGNIETRKKFSYGKFEARVKIPKGKGLWPAFWLFGGDPVYNELDIFEFGLGNSSNNQSTEHNMNMHYKYYPNKPNNQCKDSYIGPDFSQDFHIFTVIWEENKTQWFVDGELKRTVLKYSNILGQEIDCNINAVTPYLLRAAYPWDPMNIIFNLAIKKRVNAYNDEPDGSTVFPCQMEVDWVRYYVRNNPRNLYINNFQELPLSDNNFNVSANNNFNMNCDYIMGVGQQLNIVSQNSIVLKPGVQIKSGSSFVAKIDGSTSSTRSIYDENIDVIDGSFSYSENINIYPNPTNDIINIEISDIIETTNLEVFNNLGEIIFSDKITNNNYRLNLSNEPPGLYFIKINNNKKVHTERIIKQ